MLVKRKTNVKIENVGKEVNSEHPEYRPLVTFNGDLLVFTSKRQKSVDSRLNPFDENIYDDIYYSSLANNQWIKATPFSNPINTSLNDAISALSLDGKSMVVYNDLYSEGDLYITNYKNGQWEEPNKLPLTINSIYKESTSAFSVTKDTLYFISDRKDNSAGLKDIYFSVKNEDGKWLEPINVGTYVNTKFNEEGISIHPNGKMMFFSSEGHNSMGGYDIFVTRKLSNGQWGRAINLGYPINTPDDDLFFVMSGKKNIAYYSSSRDDSYGEDDIYKITFEPIRLFAEKIKPGELLPDDIKALVENKYIENIEKEPVETDENIIEEKKEEENEKVIKEETFVEEKIEDKTEDVSLEEIYKKDTDTQNLKESFQKTTLNEDQKIVLEKAKNITDQLIKQSINTKVLEILKKNPSKVIIEVINTSSGKGMDFTYPSGNKGTFVIMLPKADYEVDLLIEDISTMIGKTKLVSSKIQEELISNNIIAISEE